MKTNQRLTLWATLLGSICLAPSHACAQPEARPSTQLAPTFAALNLPDAPLPQNLLPQDQQTSTSQPQTEPQQTKSPQPDPSQPHELTPEEKRREAQEQLDQELHQRLAGVVPNFNAVLSGNALPLSPGQKMRAAFRSAIDPYQFGLAVLTSLYGQATDSHNSYDPVRQINTGYSQGFVGFTQRYGANFVDQFDGTLLGNGVFPVLLHQDARYYRMGTGSTPKRLLYSISTTVRCKGDNGKWQPSYSNLLGNLAAGGISNLYYPAADRGFALTFEQGLTVTAEGAFGALLIEFYPDIRKHFHKKHPEDPTIDNPTQPAKAAAH